MIEIKPDTKTRIFETALRLFAIRGVENASMRDIADEVGIKVASIYNHYTSKEQLVEACYDLFLQYQDSSKLTEEQCRAILKDGTKEEVVNIADYHFPEDKVESLGYAMIVLFSRMYTDETAIEKYKTMVDHSLRFFIRYFEMGIELGRFRSFDVSRVSTLFLSARLFTAQTTTIHPDILHEIQISQREIMLELINNIPFNY